MYYLIAKALLSGAVVVAVSEIAKRNNTVASIVHSLPLVSLMAFLWLYTETKDTALIGRHAFGTFWFVLPTLPMFLLMPWLIQRGWNFWSSLGVGIVLTIILYTVTMRLLDAFGVKL